LTLALPKVGSRWGRLTRAIDCDNQRTATPNEFNYGRYVETCPDVGQVQIGIDHGDVKALSFAPYVDAHPHAR